MDDRRPAAQVEQGVDALLMDGRIVHVRRVSERDTDALTALYTRASPRSRYLRFFTAGQEHHPLIVAPIATDIPAKAGTDLDEGQVAQDLQIMRMAMAVNTLGLPAVALPVGIQDSLPQAAEVIGPRYREDMCLDAAAAIEEQVGILTPIDPA
jgi:Asp-tRNA(Asn)/Glu-tRNA(Gln) amidotransferase A subunit family amidase